MSVGMDHVRSYSTRAASERAVGGGENCVHGHVHRRASDAALQRAAEKIRSSFLQVAQRELVADGVVITAMSEALAAVEAALSRAPRAAA
ncbi:MAG: hypothetical protein M3M94_00310 [Actinomycetota bacterium]|nr:hypothetical protein [Actinomycetota bacterium]